MAEASACPLCGNEAIKGPTSCRRRNPLGHPKYIKQMRFNCRDCDHVYQFDVDSTDLARRERQAWARWMQARPAQMEPTIRLTANSQQFK